MSLPICIKSQLQIHSTTVRINYILTIDEKYKASSEITSLVGCTELTLDRDCDIPYIQVTSARSATSLNSLRQEHRSFQQPNDIEVRRSILKSSLRSDYIDLSRARYIIQTLTYQESNSTASELFYTIGYEPITLPSSTVIGLLFPPLAHRVPYPTAPVHINHRVGKLPHVLEQLSQGKGNRTKGRRLGVG